MQRSKIQSSWIYRRYLVYVPGTIHACDGHRFREQTKFLRTNEIFVIYGVVEKINDIILDYTLKN